MLLRHPVFISQYISKKIFRQLLIKLCSASSPSQCHRLYTQARRLVILNPATNSELVISYLSCCCLIFSRMHLRSTLCGSTSGLSAILFGIKIDQSEQKMENLNVLAWIQPQEGGLTPSATSPMALCVKSPKVNELAILTHIELPCPNYIISPT